MNKWYINDSKYIEEILYETDVYRKEGEYDEAIIRYLTLLEKIKHDKEIYSIYGARCLRQLSFCYRKKGDASNALFYAKEAVDLARRIYINGESLAQCKSLGICCMYIGSIYDEREDYFKAMAYYEEGCEYLETVYKTDACEYSILANALVSLGRVYYKLFDYKRAVMVFRQTKELLNDNHNDARYACAIHYLNEMEYNANI